MKISVEGVIIDTQNIYAIEPIIGNDTWTYMQSYGPDHILSHSGYEFTIKFFNKKDLIIYRSGDETFKDNYWWMKFKNREMLPEYEAALKMIYDEMNEIRNTVIGYWNEDKKDIPEVAFKK
jgi:hypothetical protein